MYHVGIVGASGYTGAELIRLLHMHPYVKVTKIYSRSLAGKNVDAAYASLSNLELEFLDPGEGDFEGLDLLFLAVPAGAAGEYAASFPGKIIDIGSDFRFTDLKLYEKTYGISHKAPELLPEAAYGLPELFRSEIRKSRLVGNPGCFPTAIILAIAPFIDAGYKGEIIVSALTGTSGAGKAPGPLQHFAHRDGNFGPYRVGNHRHIPEIETILEKLCGFSHEVVFIPHLVPAVRGIVASICLDSSFGLQKARDLVTAYYKDEFFIRVRKPGESIESKNVAGSNFVDLQIYEDQNTKKLIIVSAIDNLVKGASGQAIQNMNILLDLPEKTNLEMIPIYP